MLSFNTVLLLQYTANNLGTDNITFSCGRYSPFSFYSIKSSGFIRTLNQLVQRGSYRFQNFLLPSSMQNTALATILVEKKFGEVLETGAPELGVLGVL